MLYPPRISETFQKLFRDYILPKLFRKKKEIRLFGLRLLMDEKLKLITKLNLELHDKQTLAV
jgi:hypothetical protein